MDVDPPKMKASSEPDRAGHSSYNPGIHRPHVAATDLDPGDPGGWIVTGNKERTQAAQRFGQYDGGPAVQNAKRLVGALVDRHFTTNEVATYRDDPYPQNTLNCVLHPLIQLHQAGVCLADVLVQKSATLNKKSAQAYHSAA